MKEQAGGEDSHRREVASTSGQKPRPAAASADANFGEYEDNEWDVGIGNLIDDLDADIEKSAAEVSDGNNLEEAAGMPASGTGLSSSGATRGGKLPPTNSPIAASPNVQHSATVEKGLKMKIKRTKPSGGSKSAEKHEIVKPMDPESNGKRSQASAAVSKDKDIDVNPGEVIVKSENQDFSPSDAWGCNSSVGPANQSLPTASSGPTPKKKPKLEQDGEVDASSSKSSPSVPEPRTTSDACIGTSIGTVTDPDCLGPCEPGTSVTLEGIVWQETDTGLLVVNVTWRGKTYVGTLLDCTRHDWAPPRFCESPTSDLEIRTPKGRGKRGRGSNCTPVNEVISAPETRSSTQNKLRSGKGRRGGASTFAMPPSPAKQDGAAGVKRKGRGNDGNGCGGVNGTTIGVAGGESPSGKRSRSTSCRSTPTPVGSGNNSGSSNGAGSGAGGGTTATIEPPGSPVLIECPEPNCGKKYKHINGLKYHQSHAHADSRRSSSPTSTIGSCETVKLEATAGSVSDNETEMEESVDGAVDIKTEPVDPLSTSALEPTVMLITPKQENVDDSDHAEQMPSRSGGLRFEEPNVSGSSSTVSISAPAGCSSTVSSHVSKSSDAEEEPVHHRPGPKPVVRVPAANGDKLRPVANVKPIMPVPSPQTLSLSGAMPANKPNGPLGLTNVSPLLPIQPRPSIMVDSNPASSAELDSLRRERIKNRKRVKDGKTCSGPPSAASSPSGAGEAGKSGLHAVAVQAGTNSPMGPTVGISNPPPTTVLSVSSLSPCPPPTNVEEPSSREEVQSPAYSDISDPNDSGANDSQCDVQGDGAKTASKSAEASKSPSADVSPPPPTLQPGYPNFPFYGAQLPFPVSPVPSLHRPMGGSPGRTKGPESSPSMPSPARKEDVPPAAKDEQRTRDGKAPGGDKMMPQVYPYGFNYHQYGAVDPNFLRLGSDQAYKQFMQDQERAMSDSEKGSFQNQRVTSSGGGMEKIGQGPTDLSKSVGNLGLPSGTNVTVKDVKTGGEGAVKEAKSIPMSDDKGHRQFLGASRASGGGGVGAGDEKRDLYVAVSRHGGGSVSAPKSGSSSSPKSLPPGKSEGGKEVKKDGDKKGCGVEGVKPTMETHGPPPPTATGAPSYAYLHHSYLGSPPYRPPGVPGFIDPNASMFPRIAPSMMWHGSPFAAYTPPGMPRFHEPGAAGPDAQDLSGKSIKGLDLLRHNVSIYPSGPPVTMAAAVAAHKIHELQDAANKGAGATGTAGKPPSSESGGGEMSLAMPQPSSPAIGIAEGSVTSSVSASSSASRSPPAQHHVHTHHHTHVGLGFPLPVAPQFTGPYPGAAILATPQPAVFPPTAYGASPNQ